MPDTTYYYVVSAVSGSEESADSTETSVNTTVTGPATLSAESVSVTLKKKGRRYDATALIVVVDGDGNPASGALVSGTWSIPGNGPINVQVTTGATGEASNKSPRVAAQSGDQFIFDVTDIERAGDTYGGGTTSGSATVP